ncbi:minor extracellular serine protease Vpr [Gracilibacillus ureilyticus]|uniref:Minor extracellular serine protease Vpr n=1 Tax=Gracilibacillus ureilyticus TaxID=531814 RepID=A0A1H9UP85_9BACI|nr:S8 family serine peptidase [Gracilibacillus ureilyticus]SES11128.1 minor extracellular serine protease Vpr [Gracilibacillus ureilyticus]
MRLWLVMLIMSAFQDPVSYIIEVEGNPHEIAEEIEARHPRVEILEVYDTIFNGIALKADQQTLSRLEQTGVIKQNYPVTTYKTTKQSPVNESVPFIVPEDIPYTGKGVKVGVIDTGIDYTHPDLQKNYKGGFDLVDFDEDPMETTPDQGIPTSHGTHVAGIIGANGQMKGVAPDAELYGYRALGPGGSGTSVQVMAAIEQAVKDGMDVLNLSLGNTINGPDWPTSVAVNRAAEHGVTVVIAGGNTGPEPWTIGSPATAESVISVGASTPPIEQPYLYESFSRKKIELLPLQGTPAWSHERDLQVAHNDTAPDELPADHVLVVERGKTPFTVLAKEAEERGASALLIANNEEGIFQGAVEQEVNIPVAAVSKEAGKWLKEERGAFLELKTEEVVDTITDFSSRGPVTVNWSIKPEVVAPGANIMSTVPGGYASYNGTSMAAPHIAGVAALLKEAHPDWTPGQIKAALLTTADPLAGFLPTEQGAGKVDVEEVLSTDTIIYHSLYNIGKNTSISDRSEHKMVIENISDKPVTYTFQQPEQQQAIRFYLPGSFTLKPNEKKGITIEAVVKDGLAEQAFMQGYLQLNDYSIPYLWLTEEAKAPMAMGLEFYFELLDGHYHYQLYVVEEESDITIDLYDANTYAFVQTVVERKDVPKGVLKGMLTDKQLPEAGAYIANITVAPERGEAYQYQTMIMVEK